MYNAIAIQQESVNVQDKIYKSTLLYLAKQNKEMCDKAKKITENVIKKMAQKIDEPINNEWDYPFCMQISIKEILNITENE